MKSRNTNLPTDIFRIISVQNLKKVALNKVVCRTQPISFTKFISIFLPSSNLMFFQFKNLCDLCLPRLPRREVRLYRGSEESRNFREWLMNQGLFFLRSKSKFSSQFLHIAIENIKKQGCKIVILYELVLHDSMQKDSIPG